MINLVIGTNVGISFHFFTILQKHIDRYFCGIIKANVAKCILVCVCSECSDLADGKIYDLSSEMVRLFDGFFQNINKYYKFGIVIVENISQSQNKVRYILYRMANLFFMKNQISSYDDTGQKCHSKSFSLH